MSTEHIQIFIVILICLGAAISLSFLFVIDLRTRLLPNTYVLAFSFFGIAFHTVQEFALLAPASMAGGMIVGGGFLYSVRFFANRAYKQDTLGLGDVKLMAAAGLWLGAHDVLNALIIGSCAGIVHGLVIYFVQKPGSLARLSLPAGPGFIVGILGAAAIKFLL